MSFSPWMTETASESSSPATDTDYPAVIDGHDVIARVNGKSLALAFTVTFERPDCAVTYSVTNHSIDSPVPGTEGYPPGSKNTVVPRGFNVWHSSFNEEYGEWMTGHYGHYDSLPLALIAIIYTENREGE